VNCLAVIRVEQVFLCSSAWFCCCCAIPSVHQSTAVAMLCASI